MRKLFIGAVAAVIAATSFVSSASAEVIIRHHNHGWRGHHYAYGHHHRYPRVMHRMVVRHGCVIRTVKRIDRHGNVHIRRIRSC